MGAASAFDPYEIGGFIAPGSVVALLILREAPSLRDLIGTQTGWGDLGLFVIAAFVLGHMIGAVGSLAYQAAFPHGRLPTDWVRNENQRLITAAQRRALTARVSAMEGTPVDLAEIDAASWHAMAERAYLRLHAAGRSDRIDVQTRNFAVVRNLTVAFALWLLWLLLMHRDEALLIVLMLALMAAAVAWLRAFGIEYARTLLLAFIDLDDLRPAPGLGSAER